MVKTGKIGGLRSAFSSSSKSIVSKKRPSSTPITSGNSVTRSGLRNSHINLDVEEKCETPTQQNCVVPTFPLVKSKEWKVVRSIDAGVVYVYERQSSRNDGYKNYILFETIDGNSYYPRKYEKCFHSEFSFNNPSFRIGGFHSSFDIDSDIDEADAEPFVVGTEFDVINDFTKEKSRFRFTGFNIQGNGKRYLFDIIV